MTTELSWKPVPRVQEPPLIGLLRAFQKDRLACLRTIGARYGDIACGHFGPFVVYFVNAPALAHAVLVEHNDAFDKGMSFHSAFQPVMGNGLLNSEGEFWRGQRKLIAPAFAPRVISGYAETMVAYAEAAARSWADATPLDLAAEMRSLTMRIVGKVLFDSDVFSERDALGAAITAAAEYIDYASMHLFPIPLRWPTPANRRTRAAIALIHNRVQALIDERRAAPAARDDLLSLLLRAQAADGTRMPDAQVRDEAVTLFLAGHETTANALAWTFYLLGRHPDSYARLQAEVDSVLGGRAPTAADLARLPYTLQVLKEAMRLFPPAYLVTRRALRDVDLGAFQMRQNELALIAIYSMHRRPDFYPEPGRFRPERFRPENERRLPRYAYLPFGGGPRICIGNHFALLEGHLLLATLARRVTFALLPGQRIVPGPAVTLRQRPGARVVVRRRAAGAAPDPNPFTPFPIREGGVAPALADLHCHPPGGHRGSPS